MSSGSIRIIQLPEKSSVNTDDYMAMDSSTNGTKKVKFTDLLDNNLSAQNKAADAQATGEAINTLNTNINNANARIDNLIIDGEPSVETLWTGTLKFGTATTATLLESVSNYDFLDFYTDDNEAHRVRVSSGSIEIKAVNTSDDASVTFFDIGEAVYSFSGTTVTLVRAIQYRNNQGTVTITANENIFGNILKRVDGIKMSSVALSEEVSDIRVGDDGVTYTTAGEAVRTQFSNVKADLSYFENRIDGKIANPAFELGDIYVNGSGSLTYYSSSSRLRTKQNTSKHLEVGTRVGLTDYDGYRYLMYLDNGDDTYSKATNGWIQNDFVVATTGDYLILISYVPEATITDATALGQMFIIRKGSAFENLVKANVVAFGNDSPTANWVQRIPNQDSGIPEDKTNRICTDKIAIPPYAKELVMNIASGYKCAWYAYASDGTFLDKKYWLFPVKNYVPIGSNWAYVIVGLAKTDNSTIATSASSNITIEFSTTITDAKHNTDTLTNRKQAIDYIGGTSFELGDLYVNGSGVGTYYDSPSRLRTIKGSPIALRKGVVVGMSDYTKGVYLLRKKISEGNYSVIGGTSWKTIDYLVQEDGNYEVLLKYPTEANITDIYALASLFQIKDEYGIVREATNIQNLTDVYKDELQTTIASARAKTTSRGLMFGVITDTHLDNKRVEYYNQTMENLERLNNGLQFNGIFHLGDVINGYDSADLAKEQLQYAVERLLKIGGDKTYITVGNHDNNNGGGDSERLKDYELYSYIQRYNEQSVVRTMQATSGVYDSPTSNYYVDYPTFKIRMIMFDSCYYGAGFSDDIIAWMTALLASTPSDYHFVFFTHESTESALNGGNALGNASAFKSLLAQYKDRIYCYIHGHTHLDYVGYDNEFAQIGLCCAVPDQPVSGAWVPAGSDQPTRTLGTVTQDCISVIIILPEENKVELVRFGAGSDATIPFRQS